MILNNRLQDEEMNNYHVKNNLLLFNEVLESLPSLILLRCVTELM